MYRPINWGDFRAKRYAGAAPCLPCTACWHLSTPALVVARGVGARCSPHVHLLGRCPPCVCVVAGDYADVGEEVQISQYRLDKQQQ